MFAVINGYGEELCRAETESKACMIALALQDTYIGKTKALWYTIKKVK